MQCVTVQCSTVLYSAVQCSTEEYMLLKFSAGQCSAVGYSAVQYCIVQVQCSTVILLYHLMSGVMDNRSGNPDSAGILLEQGIKLQISLFVLR